MFIRHRWLTLQSHVRHYESKMAGKTWSSQVCLPFFILCFYFLFPTNGAPSKPNIIFILTDDLDIQLGGLVIYLIHFIHCSLICFCFAFANNFSKLNVFVNLLFWAFVMVNKTGAFFYFIFSAYKTKIRYALFDKNDHF